MTCLYCGGETNTDTTAMLQEAFRKYPLVSEMCNPGGRELEFTEKGRIHLSDRCNMCDARCILMFLGEPL